MSAGAILAIFSLLLLAAALFTYLEPPEDTP